MRARVAQTDCDAAAAAAAIHGARQSVLALRQEVALDGLDAAQLRAKMAALAEQVRL